MKEKKKIGITATIYPFISGLVKIEDGYFHQYSSFYTRKHSQTLSNMNAIQCEKMWR